MTQKIIVEAKGLKTFKNELSLPDGALIKADNVVIDRDNVIESRRGFGLYGQEFGIDGDVCKQILGYKDRLIIHYGSTLAYDDEAGLFTAFAGSYSELASGLRIKSTESNGNFYFTTATGVKKISALSASEFTDSAGYIYDAGAAKGLDGTGTANTLTPGFLSITSVISYRIVWGYKDVNDNLILGAPSASIIVRNMSAVDSAVVDLVFTIPEEVSGDTDYFYQIYRSPIQDDSLTPGTATPEDELQLVFEDFPTSTDFTNGYVTVTDITPEDFREGGAFLYTNPISGGGILSANNKPPICQDIASYSGSTFYANTKTNHQKQIDIISTALLSNDDTLTIGSGVSSVTYTFKASENIASKWVQLFTAGSVSQNIDDTARSLVRVINRNSGPVYADYISSVDDVPGQILLESRTLSNTGFYVKVGNTSYSKAFNPALPTNETSVSTNQENPHYIYYSKSNEPEAVPAVNYIPIGSKDSPIVRIAPLRSSLLVFKTDGIYRLSGTDINNFLIDKQDSSALINAPDSLAILNNTIFMTTSQGVVSISEGSEPQIISRDIERKILGPSRFTNYTSATFGMGYESDRSYLIHLPTIESDTVATQCFRYNVFTQAWTRWDISKKCGIVCSRNDRIYFGPPDTNQIEEERKDFDRSDFADRQYVNSFPTSEISGLTAKLSTLINVAIGDVVFQEQYITVARFNRLLKKLDLDVGLTNTDYFLTLEVTSGVAMNNAISALVAKIKLDDTGGSYSTPSGSNVNTDLRDDFNTLIDELNASVAVFWSNYTKYTTTVEYEAIITAINKATNVVTLIKSVPFIQGDNLIFKAIECEVEWAPQHVGDPSFRKHFREATLMFERFNFIVGNVTFRTDLSDNYEGTDFRGEGNGSFGTGIFGEDTYGGQANQRPLRTYIPRNKQRCRFVTVRFVHLGARESFALTGYSVTFTKEATERAYRN